MSNGDLLDVRVPMPSESGAKVETELSLTDLLQEMTRACTQSAKQLNDQMQPPPMARGGPLRLHDTPNKSGTSSSAQPKGRKDQEPVRIDY